mgnify:FL=1
MLYKKESGKLIKLEDDGFHNEKELQKFVEENIEELLGLKFIATEFSISDRRRVDTLAYDEESNAFVIIEDKNVKNSSLVDQGFSYLSVALDRKESLVLQFNGMMNAQKKVGDFDWSQTRIIFISPEYNDRQIEATSFGDMPFQLFELKKYGDIISWRDLTKKIKGVTPRLKTVPECEDREESTLAEIKVYTEDDIITDSNPAYPQYLDLRERILELPDVTMVVLKSGIKFKVNGKRFGEVDKSGVSDKMGKFDFLIANGDTITDSNDLLKDISNRKWGNLKHRIIVNPDADMDSVMYPIKKSYEIAKRAS